MTEDDTDLPHRISMWGKSAHDMHVELNRPVHRGCRITDCRTVQYCRQALQEMLHDPDNPKRCTRCLTHDWGRGDYLEAVRQGK